MLGLLGAEGMCCKDWWEWALTGSGMPVMPQIVLAFDKTIHVLGLFTNGTRMI